MCKVHSRPEIYRQNSAYSTIEDHRHTQKQILETEESMRSFTLALFFLNLGRI